MTGSFELIDYIIFLGYAILILGVGLWVSRDKKGLSKSFKKIEKIKYERDERCAHGQKKLSTGDR